jgi:hypothetical protein
MDAPDRSRTVARSLRSAWGGRPPETSRIVASVVLLVVILYGGGRLIGLPLPVPGLIRPAAEVRLDHGIPGITRHAELALAGTTRAGASVTALIDHVTAARVFTGPDGRFELALMLPGHGEHQVRIEVRYGHQRIDELLESTIRWVADEVATPRLLAVEWWAELGGYYLVVGATPGSRIGVEGATLEPLQDERIGPTGRAGFLITTDGSTKPTLTAMEDEGTVSAPTEPLDLPALAADPPQVEAAERVDASVTLVIDRRDVTRTWVATLDPGRVEIASLTSGAIAPQTFLEEVTGPAGIAPVNSTGCLVGTIRTGQSDLEVSSDAATLTLVDSFPGVITQWNGFTDSPGLSLCLPRGMPARRDTGFVEVRLRDFVFESVSIPPTSASTETSDSGVVERVYRWDRIPFDTRVDLRLGPAAPSILSLVPKLDATTDTDIGDGRVRFLDALVWRLLGSLGTLLLLAIVTSRLAAGLGQRGAPVRNVLVVTLALGLAPAFSRLDLAATELSNVPALLGIEDLSVRWTFAEWILSGFVTAVAAGAAWALRRRRQPFWEAVALALALTGAGWLGLTVVGRGALAIVAGPDPIRPELVRLVTWFAGLLVIVVPLTYLWAELRRVADPGRRNPARAGMIRWVAGASIAAALLSLPAGVEGGVGATQAQAWSWMRLTLGNLASLATVVVGIAVLVLLVLVTRHAWAASKAWDVDAADPQQPTSPSSERPGATARWHLLPALATIVLAGFAITTSGGLQPLSFVAALATFAVWLRPATPPAATPIATASATPSAATHPSSAGGSADVPRAEGSAPPALAAPQPTWSVWSNVRFALGCGLAFLTLPLVLYITQYPIAGVSRADALYLQHVLVTLGRFSLSWLFVALGFGLGFEHLRGRTGLRKGLLLGLAILLVTVPFQAIYGILTVFSPLELAIWIFDVVAFTTLLGAAFDLRQANAEAPLDFFQPNAVLAKLREQSGVPALVTGIGIVLATIVTTTSGLITNQIVQIVTQVVTPFLPLPPT